MIINSLIVMWLVAGSMTLRCMSHRVVLDSHQSLAIVMDAKLAVAVLGTTLNLILYLVVLLGFSSRHRVISSLTLASCLIAWLGLTGLIIDLE